ncbi:MAG: CCA tRNA nucleotidyltransferase [Chloroflexi bacterium]|nr:CCA tRNA nucleotidyltransferase [Chloroflexota bacterium]
MELLKKLEERIAPRLMAVVRMAGDIAADRGQALYLVGGAVRDLLLGRVNIDLDLVVEGDAPALARSLAEKLDAKIISHDRFGASSLAYAGFHLDLVTARSETYEKPGALPVVRPGTIQEDLGRRDFTINAMALGLSPPRPGELSDPFGGRADLEHRFIRILHDRSFIDDATRLFRAVRYESRLGFKLEPGTEALAKRDAGYVQTISGDRLRHEMELVLAENEPETILQRAGELGILTQLHPRLKGDDWLARKFREAREEFQPKQPPVSVYLSLLAWNLTLAQNEELSSRLNFPGRTGRVMRDTLRLKQKLGDFRPGMKNSEVYRLLARFLPYAIQVNITAADDPLAAGYLRLFLDVIRGVKVETDGARLKALGAPQGPAMGKILHDLHMARLDGLIKDTAGEEELARELIEEVRRLEGL